MLAGLVLAVTIFDSQKRDQLVWKSSSLALLFHGLRGGDGQELAARDSRTMEDLARTMRARLVEHENGKIALRTS